MSRPSRTGEKPIQGSSRHLTTASIMLAVFVFTMAGAWSEARWPRREGADITTRPRGEVQASDLLAQLQRVDGVRDAVAIFQGSLAAEDIESTGWREVRFYANQTSASESALAFVPPDPALRLYRGRLPDVHSLDETVIGYELAQVLRLSIGDNLTIHERSFTVAGIWGPSSSLPGNFAQVSMATAESLASSSPLSIYAYLAFPMAAENTWEIAKRIWDEVPDLEVVSPQWEMARAGQMRTVLLLALGGTVLLLLLVCVPLEADWVAQKGSSVAYVAILAALTGLAAACGVSYLANLYTRQTLGLTAFQVSARLGVLAVALVGGSLLLTAPWSRGLARPLRYALTALALALCGAAWVLVGTLSASLHASLAEAQRTAADWITLPGARADAAFLRDLARVPGIRGYAIEAYGGLANEDEDRWLGLWPASGVFYGIQFAGGEGTLSVPYRLEYWQGGPLDPDAPDEAVVGYGLAQGLGLQIGDPVWIRDVRFAVVGIRRPLLHDPQSDVNYRIDISLDAFRRVSQDPSGTGEATLLIPPAESQQDKTAYLSEVGVRLNVGRVQNVEDRLAEIAGSYPAAWTLTPASAQEATRHAGNLYTTVMVILGLVLMAASALAVSGTVADMLSHDALQIGLLKALGSDEGTLLGQYLQKASVLGVAGAVPGVVCGWAAASWLNRWASAGSAQLRFTPSLGAGVFFCLVLTSMAAALGPVSHAIRQDVTTILYSAPEGSCQTGAIPSVSGLVQQGGTAL
jgi:hypothetical protein